MKLKITGIGGYSSVIQLDNDASLGHLIEATHAPLSVAGIRFGYPPQRVNLNAGSATLTLDSLGICSGEKINLIFEDEGSLNKQPASLSATKQQVLPPTKCKITLPDGEENVLQVHQIPDDNSCLFHSLSYCVYKDISLSPQLRTVCSTQIRSDKNLYSDAVLDKPNEEYAQWILRKDSWGGGIEIAILSKNFSLAIYVLDMDALKFEKFNEDQFTHFVIIMFNGVHYDALELQNHTTVFDRHDELYSEAVLEAALEIAKKLKKGGHSFNTRRDRIVCNNCHAILVGEREVARHAESTGHFDFGQAKT
ncbi:related to Ubiquitin thioesterase OTU1 [Zygosaccharomyces bailii]|nr:related to Ubiquitin thioesterase OTU1 [Zygosaccharomyces bailii]